MCPCLASEVLCPHAQSGAGAQEEKLGPSESNSGVSGRPAEPGPREGGSRRGQGALRTYVLDMVEAERGSPPRVLQGLRREGLVMAMDEAANQEEMLGGCGAWARAPQPPGGHHVPPPPRTLPRPTRTSWVQGSLELAEDVGIFSGDAGRLQDGHAEGEGAAQAKVVQGGVQGPIQGGFLGAVQEAFRGHRCWEPRAKGRGGTRGAEPGLGNWPAARMRAKRRGRGDPPEQVLLLTSSAEGPESAAWPWPSTIRSSSWEVPERDMPTPGQDSAWNCAGGGGVGQSAAGDPERLPRLAPAVGLPVPRPPSQVLRAMLV